MFRRLLKKHKEERKRKSKGENGEGSVSSQPRSVETPGAVKSSSNGADDSSKISKNENSLKAPPPSSETPVPPSAPTKSVVDFNSAREEISAPVNEPSSEVVKNGEDPKKDPDASADQDKKEGRPSLERHHSHNTSRYDEFASYNNRSERSHVHPDKAPTKEELAQRRVVVSEEVMIYNHEGEGMTDDELRAYFMQEEDFRRCDADVELTTFRWEKHKKSKKPFDESTNTLRGLEDVIYFDPKREAARDKHVQSVLTEILKQRTKGKKELDWEKVRAAAHKTSEASAKRAAEMGAQDAKDIRGGGLTASKRYGSFKGSRGNNATRKSVGKMRMMLSFTGAAKK